MSMDDEYRGRSIGAIIGVHREQNGKCKKQPPQHSQTKPKKPLEEISRAAKILPEDNHYD